MENDYNHPRNVKARTLEYSQEHATLEWKRHTELHWSIWIGEQQLSFWPSVNKFLFPANRIKPIVRTQFGDIHEVEKFYKENS